MDGADAGVAFEAAFDLYDVLPIALVAVGAALAAAIARAGLRRRRPRAGATLVDADGAAWAGADGALGGDLRAEVVDAAAGEPGAVVGEAGVNGAPSTAGGAGSVWRSMRALGNGRFALLWVGQTISRIGDFVYEIVLAWWILEITGSGAVMGSVLIVTFLPVAIFTLVGGAVVDRVPRVPVMFISDLVRAVAVLGVAAWAYAGHLTLWPVYALGILFGVGNAFFNPAYFALVPELVDEADLPSANALTSMSFQLGRVVGPAIGGLIVAAGGTQLGLLLNGLSFVVAAALLGPLLGLRRGGQRARGAAAADVAPAGPGAPDVGSAPVDAVRAGIEVAGATDAAPAAPAGWLADIRAGFAVVAASPIVRTGIAVNALAAACLVGPFLVAMPFLIEERFDADPRVLGFLLAVFPVGFLLGSLWGGRHDKLPHRGRIMYGGIGLAAVMLAIYGLPVPLYVLAAAALVNGFSLELTGLAWVGLLQDHIPGDKLGRVASLDQLAGFITTPIAFAIAGWTTDAFGAAPTFLAGGLLAAALAAAALAVPAVWRA